MPKQRQDTAEDIARRAEHERAAAAPQPVCIGRPGIRGWCEVTDCPRCTPIRQRMRQEAAEQGEDE